MSPELRAGLDAERSGDRAEAVRRYAEAIRGDAPIPTRVSGAGRPVRRKEQ